jgi:DNA-binding transcriptional MocR family regulator
MCSLSISAPAEAGTQMSLEWAGEAGALIVEDDYDAEFRYDRAPVGSLQGLAPDCVAYVGSTSKTLAPTLRLGWLLAPARLVRPLADEVLFSVIAPPRLQQLAFADFLLRGELDRHLRRMRLRYRRRRDLLVRSLARELPMAEVGGIAAGLHVVASSPAATASDASSPKPASDTSASTASASTGSGPAVGRRCCWAMRWPARRRSLNPCGDPRARRRSGRR